MNPPSLPKRTGREYRDGRSTPRMLRVNDVLWEDFAAWAESRGWKAAAAIRALMRQVLAGAKAKGWRNTKRATRELHSGRTGAVTGTDLAVTEVGEEDLFVHQSLAAGDGKKR